MPRVLYDQDTGDQGQRRYLRVYTSICFAIVLTAIGFLVVGASLLLLAFPLIGIALGLAVGEGIWYLTDRSAAAIAKVVHSAGDLPYTSTFSAEESLVARGDYTGATAAYRAQADAHPQASAPALRLAELYRGHLHDPVEAERWYLEARRRAGQPGFAGNQLIDLYRATGNRGRLMAELARFAAGHRGTEAGDAARREVQVLKAELDDS